MFVVFLLRPTKNANIPFSLQKRDLFLDLVEGVPYRFTVGRSVIIALIDRISFAEMVPYRYAVRLCKHIIDLSEVIQVESLFAFSFCNAINV